MLLIHPVREVGRLLPALIPLFFINRSGDFGAWWTYAGTAAVILLGLSRWFTTRFRVTATQVELRAGLIFRRRKATPLDRVRTIDISASPLHRVLGLAKVTIGTGVSSTNPDWLVLDGLQAQVAHQLRADLLHRRSVAKSPTAASDAWSAPIEARTAAEEFEAYPESAEPEQELYALRAGWIRYAPFTMSGLLTALAIVGFGWQILENSDFTRQRESVLKNIYDYFVAADFWTAALQIAGGTLLVIMTLSIAGYILAFWQFRLSRHSGGTLNVTRGLLTTRATSIEERRLRGIEVAQPLLLRLAGGARLLAVSTGLKAGSATQGGNLLVPPSPYAEVARVAGSIIGEQSAIDGPLIRHGSAARRRRHTRALVPALVLLAGVVLLRVQFDFPVWPIGIAVAFLAVAPALAEDRYRALGHSLSERHLVSRLGSLSRQRTALRREGIISFGIRSSYFQRRAGLVTLIATTAGGRQHYEVPDVQTAEALRVARAAIPNLLEEFAVGT